MNNKLDNQEDQATELRSLLNEVQQGEKVEENRQSIAVDDTKVQKREVDVLNLPPRREVHSKNKKRTHVKIGSPLLRLLIVLFILLGVLTGAYFLWGEELFNATYEYL